MADQLTNRTTNAAIVPEIWSARFYDVLLNELPFASLISNEYSGEIQAMGDIVNIATFPEFDTAGLLAEGAVNDADAISVGTQQLVINSRAAKDVIITKEAQLQSLPFMDALREKMIYSINKKIQADIIAAIVPSAANPDNTLAYTAGTTLALVDILAAKENLDAQNVPLSDRYAVLGSGQMNDLFNIVGYTSKDFIPSGSPLSSGIFQFPIAGFNINTTNEVGNTSYFFHRSFLTLAIQQGLNISMYDLGVQGVRGMRVNADVFYGIRQLDNTRVVTIA